MAKGKMERLKVCMSVCIIIDRRIAREKFKLDQPLHEAAIPAEAL
jgi:hypothetical protein